MKPLRIVKPRKKCGCPSEEEEAIIIERSMKLYGFYIHYIPDGKPLNFHTHGLTESQNHIDLQIAFNIPFEVAMSILHCFVDKIKTGQKFKNGDIVEGVLGNGYKVKLWQTVECGRPVLRLLLPDKEGRYPDDPNCDERFLGQLEVDVFDYKGEGLRS